MHVASGYGTVVSYRQFTLLVHHERLLTGLQLEGSVGRGGGASATGASLRGRWTALIRELIVVLVQQTLRRLITRHNKLLTVKIERGSLSASCGATRTKVIHRLRELNLLLVLRRCRRLARRILRLQMVVVHLLLLLFTEAVAQDGLAARRILLSLLGLLLLHERSLL